MLRAEPPRPLAFSTPKEQTPNVASKEKDVFDVADEDLPSRFPQPKRLDTTPAPQSSPPLGAQPPAAAQQGKTYAARLSASLANASKRNANGAGHTAPQPAAAAPATQAAPPAPPQEEAPVLKPFKSPRQNDPATPKDSSAAQMVPPEPISNPQGAFSKSKTPQMANSATKGRRGRPKKIVAAAPKEGAAAVVADKREEGDGQTTPVVSVCCGAADGGRRGYRCARGLLF